MDIKPLRYFVTLAETRHFGRAADSLHITQPPLSRQLAALEDDLGIKLVERNSRNVVLTAAGERFYLDAKAILTSLEQAVHNVRAAATGELGKLKVGFTMCAAYSVVPRYAQTFKAEWSNVALHLQEVVSNDLAKRVASGDIDVAIMLPGAFDSRLIVRTVLIEPLCVALSLNHPLADSQSLSIKELAKESFVLASESVAPSLYSAIINHCRNGGFEPDILFEVQLQQTVLSLVDEGGGVALVPTSMRKSRMAGVVFSELIDAPMIEQVLVWSPNNRNPCLVKFLECVGI